MRIRPMPPLGRSPPICGAPPSAPPSAPPIASPSPHARRLRCTPSPSHQSRYILHPLHPFTSRCLRPGPGATNSAFISPLSPPSLVVLLPFPRRHSPLSRRHAAPPHPTPPLHPPPTMTPTPTAFVPAAPLRGVLARTSARVVHHGRAPVCGVPPPSPSVPPSPIAAAVPATPCLTRRAVLSTAAAAAAAAALAGAPRPASAAAPAIAPGAAAVDATVTDEQIGFMYTPPPSSDFTRVDTAISGGRRLTVYTHNTSGSDSNLSVVATGVTSDFTALTSFGSVDNVAKTILGSSGKGVDSEMVAVAKRPADNAYVFEYKMRVRDGPTRRLLTVFSLQPGRWIITLTAQAREEEWPDVERELRAAVDSYRLLQVDK